MRRADTSSPRTTKSKRSTTPPVGGRRQPPPTSTVWLENQTAPSAYAWSVCRLCFLARLSCTQRVPRSTTGIRNREREVTPRARLFCDLQPCVLCLRAFQDRDVGIRILPQCEERLIGRFRPGLVSR